MNGKRTRDRAGMDRGGQQHLWINRRHHRARVDLPCELCLPGGDSVPALVLNLSAGGLKFCCGQDALFDLLPEGQRMPGQVAGITIGICLQFPSGDAPQTRLRVKASVVHTERLAQDIYHVGVQFIDLDKASARAVEDYVEECRDLQRG